MSDQDPSWKPIQRYSDFEEAMHPDNIAEMLREIMEISNRDGIQWFVVCSLIIEERDDRALLSPDFEGELVGVDGESDAAVLVLKDVTVMHAEDVPDPEVIKYTTLETHDAMRIALTSIADIVGNGSRLGNDFVKP
ncbi:MAG: hypothetical protein JWO35_856 [Candidatus Saccharibacteria bacterium]|nr:hypothetical protein [Candidatus Saccharibacteria bacterium]